MRTELCRYFSPGMFSHSTTGENFKLATDFLGLLLQKIFLFACTKSHYFFALPRMYFVTALLLWLKQTFLLQMMLKNPESGPCLFNNIKSETFLTIKSIKKDTKYVVKKEKSGSVKACKTQQEFNKVVWDLSTFRGFKLHFKFDSIKFISSL